MALRTDWPALTEGNGLKLIGPVEIIGRLGITIGPIGIPIVGNPRVTVYYYRYIFTASVAGFILLTLLITGSVTTAGSTPVSGTGNILAKPIDSKNNKITEIFLIRILLFIIFNI